MSRWRISRRAFIRASAGVAGVTAGVTPEFAESNLEGESTECSAALLQKTSKLYKPRYDGPRWHLIYGSYKGVEEFALNELQRMTQRCVPYVMEVHHAEEPVDQDANVILLGTAADNPLIAKMGSEGRVKLPTEPQGFTITCLKSAWSEKSKDGACCRRRFIGVLYGVVELNKKLASVSPDDRKEMPQALDNLGEFSAYESPVIENRGIWSWGYVIYDYRRFIDNMARLRMNRLLFWKVDPPLNCQEIISTACAFRESRLCSGFAWGWGMDSLDRMSSEHRRLN